MALPRGIDLITDELRAALLPREQPLAYELVTHLTGHSAVGTGRDMPRSGLRFEANPLDLLAGSGGIEVDQGWIDAKIAGVVAGGDHGSIGDLFAKAIAATSVPSVLVTSLRLLIVPWSVPRSSGADGSGGTGRPQGPPVQPAFEVDRRAVVGVRRAAKLLQRARYRFDFVDGSWATGTFGVFFTGAGRRVVTALGFGGS